MRPVSRVRINHGTETMEMTQPAQNADREPEIPIELNQPEPTNMNADTQPVAMDSTSDSSDPLYDEIPDRSVPICPDMYLNMPPKSCDLSTVEETHLYYNEPRI